MRSSFLVFIITIISCFFFLIPSAKAQTNSTVYNIGPCQFIHSDGPSEQVLMGGLVYGVCDKTRVLTVNGYSPSTPLFYNVYQYSANYMSTSQWSPGVSGHPTLAITGGVDYPFQTQTGEWRVREYALGLPTGYTPQITILTTSGVTHTLISYKDIPCPRGTTILNRGMQYPYIIPSLSLMGLSWTNFNVGGAFCGKGSAVPVSPGQL